LVARVGVDQARDALDLALGNLGHVFAQLFPIAPVADLLYHARKNGTLELTKAHCHLRDVFGTLLAGLFGLLSFARVNYDNRFWQRFI
jgi:hypothetical protein